MREEALLAQAHVLTKKHEELAAATGQNFNLFKVLGRETDKVGLFKEWGKRLSDLEGDWYTIDEGAWWLAWTWPSENVLLQKMGWLRPDVIRQLRKESAVDPLVVDIQGTIDALEGCNADSSSDEWASSSNKS